MSYDSLVEGLLCPKCGHMDSLNVSAMTTVKVVWDGSEDVGDHEWDDQSFASCPSCHHSGRVINFFPEPEVVNDLILENENPMECPKCQARTDFEFVLIRDNRTGVTERGQRHTCLGCKHVFFSIADSDED